MHRPSWQSVFFASWLVVGQAIILYGRFVFQYIILEMKNAVAPSGIVPLAILVLGSTFYAAIRVANLNLKQKMMGGLMTATAAAFGAQTLSGVFSVLACVMHFYLFFVGLIAVGLHDCINREMRREFWSDLFDHIAKLMQYLLALFIGGVAVLRYVYPPDRAHEFPADAFYCTITLIFSFMLIAYWVMLPVWLRVVEAFATDDEDRSTSTRNQDGVEPPRDFSKKESG